MNGIVDERSCPTMSSRWVPGRMSPSDVAGASDEGDVVETALQLTVNLDSRGGRRRMMARGRE